MNDLKLRVETLSTDFKPRGVKTLAIFTVNKECPISYARVESKGDLYKLFGAYLSLHDYNKVCYIFEQYGGKVNDEIHIVGVKSQFLFPTEFRGYDFVTVLN